jgi:hypothetical protein
MRIALIALLAVSPAFAQNAPPAEGPITCSSPVAAGDSAKTLKQRYGDEVVTEELPGAEATSYAGMVLHPRAPDWRIEVWFTDDTLSKVEYLGLHEKTSRWNVAGVAIGTSLADVQKLNGRPFLILGFDWDYGGWLADWKGGTFDRPLPGGCKLSLRFSVDAKTPNNFEGEGVKISSDNPALNKLKPVVSEISVKLGAK